MSDHPQQDNGTEDVATQVATRTASVTLRSDEAESYASMMDPAHQALADALKITYLLLRVAMIGLGVLFVFSGVQRVSTGEEGVALRFGRIVGSDLKPGPHFSWPQPIGELVKLSTGNITLQLQDEFFPTLSEQQERDFALRGTDAIAGMGSSQLDPAEDGYILTADVSIGHLRADVVYTRDDATAVLRNILPEDERSIVRAAIERGVVHAASSMTIDEVYRRIPDARRPTGSYREMENVAGEIAQDVLDGLDSGITLQAVTLGARMPPQSIINDFNSVTRANEDAGKETSEANAIRESKLTSTAGDAAQILLAQIDRYERRLAEGDRPGADSTLDNIMSILEGLPVEIDGREIDPVVSGKVATLLQGAKQYRADLVSRTQRDVATYNAKLASFNANPEVLINSDWADALGAVFANSSVQSLLVPMGGATPILMINRDPAIEASAERERGRRDVEAATERKRREDEIKRYQQRLEQTDPVDG